MNASLPHHSLFSQIPLTWPRPISRLRCFRLESAFPMRVPQILLATIGESLREGNTPARSTRPDIDFHSRLSTTSCPQTSNRSAGPPIRNNRKKDSTRFTPLASTSAPLDLISGCDSDRTPSRRISAAACLFSCSRFLSFCFRFSRSLLGALSRHSQWSRWSYPCQRVCPGFPNIPS